MESKKIENNIEALLFWKGEPLSIKELSRILEKSEDEIRTALNNIKENLKDRGLTLIEIENEFMLGTSLDASALIEKLVKEELIKDLGKAGLETIAIILYKGAVRRSEIDYIRGVNSTFILRNLMIRGLVEKNPAEDDHRTFIYKPTFELLSYLGVDSVSKLPEYEKIQEEIQKIKTEADMPRETSGESSESAPQENLNVSNDQIQNSSEIQG